jgi:uncharacterized protein (TIGR03118 family)
MSSASTRRLSERRPKRRLSWALRALVALAIVIAMVPAVAAAARALNHHTVYVQENLISDLNGVARITDPNLVNPWGLAAGPSTPLWIADNGTDVSTLYTGGVHESIPKILPLVVAIPGGAPTGLVFNATTDFVIHSGAASAPAKFIFDSEAGKIVAWSPVVPPLTSGQVKFSSPDGAVFKGLAIASTSGGSFLYATDFHNGVVDVFDKNFNMVTLSGHFTDPNIPAGFAPFGIQLLNGRLFVTYAKQDAAKHDDVSGPGNGFVDVYNTSGHLVRRLISKGDLNSPWGLVMAPIGFGMFTHDLLVGNFGDGAIHAYDPKTGALLGPLMNHDGNPIVIDSLWGLRFGNGVIGTRRTLLFTAGIGGEGHGLFGEIFAATH